MACGLSCAPLCNLSTYVHWHHTWTLDETELQIQAFNYCTSERAAYMNLQLSSAVLTSALCRTHGVRHGQLSHRPLEMHSVELSDVHILISSRLKRKYIRSLIRFDRSLGPLVAT